MLSESRSLTLMGVCSVWPHNSMRHNEDVVFIYGIFVKSYIRYEKKFISLCKYKFLSI